MSREVMQQALLNLEVDANAIFNYPSNETSQNVRDVINWYAESIRTFTLDEVASPDHMDALRFADEIDPLTRKANPDNLTLSCAAKVLRNLVQQEEQQSCDRPEQMARLGWQCFECPACGSEGARAFPKPEQEPVAWLQIGVGPLHEGDVIARTTKPKEWNPEWWKFEPLYTSPPQRQPLTEEQLDVLALDNDGLPNSHFEFARAIEAAHGIGDKT